MYLELTNDEIIQVRIALKKHVDDLRNCSLDDMPVWRAIQSEAESALYKACQIEFDFS